MNLGRGSASLLTQSSLNSFLVPTVAFLGQAGGGIAHATEAFHY